MIILHCSASDNPAHDNIETIRKWHTQRGFKGYDGIPNTQDDRGYHQFINKAGVAFQGRIDDQIGAHCKNYNKNSIGICLSGLDVFTDAQFETAAKLCAFYMKKYSLEITDIVPHNLLDKKGKTCPNFKIEKVTSLVNKYL